MLRQCTQLGQLASRSAFIPRSIGWFARTHCRAFHRRAEERLSTLARPPPALSPVQPQLPLCHPQGGRVPPTHHAYLWTRATTDRVAAFMRSAVLQSFSFALHGHLRTGTCGAPAPPLRRSEAPRGAPPLPEALPPTRGPLPEVPLPSCVLTCRLSSFQRTVRRPPAEPAAWTQRQPPLRLLWLAVLLPCRLLPTRPGTSRAAPPFVGALALALRCAFTLDTVLCVSISLESVTWGAMGLVAAAATTRARARFRSLPRRAALPSPPPKRGGRGVL